MAAFSASFTSTEVRPNLPERNLQLLLALAPLVKATAPKIISGEVPLELPIPALEELQLLVNDRESAVRQKVGKLISVLPQTQHLVLVGRGAASVQENTIVRLETCPAVSVLELHNSVVRLMTNVDGVADLILHEALVLEGWQLFRSLRKLTLSKSPIMPSSLSLVGRTLRSLSISCTIEPLPPSLFTSPEGAEEEHYWKVLTEVEIRDIPQRLGALDISWQRASNITKVTLRNVKLVTVQHLTVLQFCHRLMYLDVSDNQLVHLDVIDGVAPQLQVLIAGNNLISTTRGIANLRNLVKLDLENNSLAEWVQIRDVAAQCTHLLDISVAANPITHQVGEDEVSTFVSAIFNLRRGLVVDGRPANPSRVSVEMLCKYLHLFERRVGGDGRSSNSLRASASGGWSDGEESSTRNPSGSPGRSDKRKKPRPKKAKVGSGAVIKYADPLATQRKYDLGELQATYGSNWLQVASHAHATANSSEEEDNKGNANGIDDDMAAALMGQVDGMLAASFDFSSPEAQRALRRIKQEGEGRKEGEQRGSATVQSTPIVVQDDMPLPQNFLFFLDILMQQDWSYEDSGLRINCFPKKLKVSFLPVTAGDGVSDWELLECEPHPAAFEAVLHDASDRTVASNARFVNKTLFRIVAVHVGNTMCYRLEMKRRGEQFGDRLPYHTVVVDEPSASKFHPLHCSVYSEKGLEVVAEDVRATSGPLSKVGVFKPDAAVVIACFIVPTGEPSRIFVEVLQRQLNQCLDELSSLGISRRWPRFHDRLVVRKEGEATQCDVVVSPLLTMEALRGRVEEGTKYKESLATTLGQQRLPVSRLVIDNKEIILHLKGFVLDGDPVLEDEILGLWYVNALRTPDDRSLEPEQSMLAIVTTSTLLLIEEENYWRMDGVMKGASDDLELQARQGSFKGITQEALDDLLELYVYYNMQFMRLDFFDDVSLIVATRDVSSTLAFLAALSKAKPRIADKFNVIGAPYAKELGSMYVCSVSVLMEVDISLGYAPGHVACSSRMYPQRYIPDSNLAQVTIILTPTEIIVYDDINAVRPFPPQPCYRQLKRVSINELTRIDFTDHQQYDAVRGAPVGALVAEGSKKKVFPLMFSLVFQSQRTQWVFCGQHPAGVGALVREIRSRRPSIPIGSLVL